MFLLAESELHRFSSSPGSECSSPLQPAHMTQYRPQPTHLDHEYRDTIFLVNIATLSYPRRHNFNNNHRENPQTHTKREFSLPPQSALYNTQSFRPYLRIRHSWFQHHSLNDKIYINVTFLQNVSRGTAYAAPQLYPSVPLVSVACLSKLI